MPHIVYGVCGYNRWEAIRNSSISTEILCAADTANYIVSDGIWNPADILGGYRKNPASNGDFLPARRHASAGNSDRNVYVRPSVRPSVTRRYCIKTKKAIVMISSSPGSPMILVF